MQRLMRHGSLVRMTNRTRGIYCCKDMCAAAMRPVARLLWTLAALLQADATLQDIQLGELKNRVVDSVQQKLTGGGGAGPGSHCAGGPGSDSAGTGSDGEGLGRTPPGLGRTVAWSRSRS